MQIVCKNCIYYGGTEQKGDQTLMRCLRYWDILLDENPNQYSCDDFSRKLQEQSEK